ncbi:STAS domain-containing protein, partial [Janthinobacterium sp.]|uniref:STAS domain-containing protein n=1 Tax=Janthinobacterium sp. TaxID=1871054 RepID=UPI00293D47CE
RRDAPAGWLLLLELLQLLQREKDFEETSMDYCITYEVSPPPYIAPAKVATAAPQSAPAGAARFMLPPLIDADCAALLEAIDAHAVQDGALVFDCSRLARVGFGAAGQLLARLRPLAEAGKTIEFRDLNHLVAALLRLLAFGDIARLFPHKY